MFEHSGMSVMRLRMAFAAGVDVRALHSVLSTPSSVRIDLVSWVLWNMRVGAFVEAMSSKIEAGVNVRVMVAAPSDPRNPASEFDWPFVLGVELNGGADGKICRKSCGPDISLACRLVVKGSEHGCKTLPPAACRS